MIKIEKACPNCGGHDVKFVNYIYRDVFLERHSIVCNICGMKTPRINNKKATIECWNNDCIYVAPVRKDDDEE